MSNNFCFKRCYNNSHAALSGTALDRKKLWNSRNNQINLYFRPLICNFAGSMKQVRPKKNLGQHFLTDLSIAKRIADTVDEPYGDLPVLEVGPGMGVMTQYLVEKPRPLKVVEIDRESVAYLKGTLFKEQPSAQSSAIIEGDFLRMDLKEVFDGQQFVLTGNYPYDISSQIFFKMLDNRDLIPCCTGMIQHEVAVRMAAHPGNKQYGILSVLIQAWYNVEYLFTVEPSVFNPPPKVQSAVIRMTRNEVQHLGCDEQLFKRVVKTVFNQRRKMLRVSLKQLLSNDAIATLNAQLSTVSSQLSLALRPEQLTIAQFVELTNAIDALCASTNN
jgi:16S rRNA (adenine1518-N6/adenine1519-N6)-dimethyltransferase